MAEFLVLFRSSKDTFETMDPHEIQRFNRKWEHWWAEGRTEGWMLDASNVDDG